MTNSQQSGMDVLLGTGPEVNCKVFNADISVHWFPTAARPGTPCLCGATVMKEPDDD